MQALKHPTNCAKECLGKKRKDKPNYLGVPLTNSKVLSKWEQIS